MGVHVCAAIARVVCVWGGGGVYGINVLVLAAF